MVTRFEFWRGANPLTPLETPPRKYLESFHANECKSWKFYYILYFNFKASQFIRQLSKQAINHSLIFRLGGILSHLKEVCVDTQCFLVHFRMGFASYKTKNSKSKILKNNKKEKEEQKPKFSKKKILEFGKKKEKKKKKKKTREVT